MVNTPDVLVLDRLGRKAQCGETRRQSLEDLLTFHPREVVAKAEVNTRSQCQVRVGSAVYFEAIRFA